MNLGPKQPRSIATTMYDIRAVVSCCWLYNPCVPPCQEKVCFLGRPGT